MSLPLAPLLGRAVVRLHLLPATLALVALPRLIGVAPVPGGALLLPALLLLPVGVLLPALLLPMLSALLMLPLPLLLVLVLPLLLMQPLPLLLLMQPVVVLALLMEVGQGRPWRHMAVIPAVPVGAPPLPGGTPVMTPAGWGMVVPGVEVDWRAPVVANRHP